jgi:hypothetical protein
VTLRPEVDEFERAAYRARRRVRAANSDRAAVQAYTDDMAEAAKAYIEAVRFRRVVLRRVDLRYD